MSPPHELSGSVAHHNAPVTDHVVEAIPDSTSNTQPNTGHTDGIQVSGACNADNQMQVAETDSNYYRNVSMWVNDEEVIMAGTKSVYDVTTCPTTS